ncbi:MAG: type 4a pilus biogenesis protein PilO [Candidatus Margulisiibacteriota bacterium]
MDLLRLSDRERNLLYVVISLLIFLIFYYFLLMPTWNQISTLTGNIKKEKEAIRIAELKLNLLKTYEKRITVPLENTVLSDEQKNVSALKELTQLLVTSDLDIVQIKPLVDTKQKKLLLTLSCAGGYQALYNFLSNLNKLRTIIVVDLIEVTSGAEKKSPLNLKMQLTAYY